jgi:hypothetical protein
MIGCSTRASFTTNAMSSGAAMANATMVGPFRQPSDEARMNRAVAARPLLEVGSDQGEHARRGERAADALRRACGDQQP